MPTKAGDVESALVDSLLRALGSLRERGGDAYPPTLRRLADATGGSPTDAQVQTAAGKKAFTSAAVVTAKVGRKPSLDAPVFFKEDAPAKPPAKRRAASPKPKPKDDGSELARRMVLVLESQRTLGADAYPPTLRRLAALCDANPSDPRVAKAAAHKELTGRAVVAAKAKGKPLLEAPVLLREDVDCNLAAALPALLRFALAPVSTTSKGKTIETTAFTPTEITGRLVADLQKPLLEALELGMERQAFPTDVAWVLTKGKPYVFLVANVRPVAARPEAGDSAPARSAEASPPRPSRDFAGAFREAFAQLDRRNGSTNFVKLADMRGALDEHRREAFDAGLRALRLAGEFALDSHEGLHGSLSPEDREAGVLEAGSLLVYVSRR
jgi:hypothetical protein